MPKVSRNQLELLKTQHCKVTRTGVVFPDRALSIDEWRDDLKTLVGAALTAADVLPLAIGQMIVYAEDNLKASSNGEQAIQQELGLKVDAALNIFREKLPASNHWARVCRNVARETFEEFMGSLTFSHHELVAVFEDHAVQRDWLLKAKENKWSRLDLQEAILKANAAREPRGLGLDYLPNFTKAKIDFNRSIRMLKATPVSQWDEAQRKEICSQLDEVEEEIEDFRGRIQSATPPRKESSKALH